MAPDPKTIDLDFDVPADVPAGVPEKSAGTPVFKFCVLGTSSNGNCTLVQTAGTTFLIDAGFSGKVICEQLQKLRVAPEQIDAVFITHEHADHSHGITGLAKFRNIQWFATRGTARALSEKKVAWNIFGRGEILSFRDLKIRSFDINHDSQQACAYTFACGNEKLAWLSDCGKISTMCHEQLRDATTIFLESNYDKKMLMDSARPFELKHRIMSPSGHLSNEDCANFLRELENSVLRRLYFVHISRECNDLSLVAAAGTRVALEKWRDLEAAEIVNPHAMMPENARFGF